MTKILFAWELGMGLGHLQRIKKYCDLCKNAEVYVALRDLKYAYPIFSNTDITMLAAPFFQGVVYKPIENTLSYAYLLYNCGFADKNTLQGLVLGWRGLFDTICPDIVVFEHSPSALLAARGYDFKKVVVGTGFTCPPAGKPFGVFFPDQINAVHKAEIDNVEQVVVDVTNQCLSSIQAPLIDELADLYADVDASLVSTIAELDHFHGRDHQQYIGVPKAPLALPPSWPDVQGKRIFVYTHNFKNLASLLCALRSSNQPTIVYSSTVDQLLMEEYASASLCFSSQALDIHTVAKSCELAITNGNCNVSSQLLLQGVPLLTVPLHREQQIFCRKLVKTGACLIGDPNNVDQLIQVLSEMANNESYKFNAKKMADKHINGVHNDNQFQAVINSLIN